MLNFQSAIWKRLSWSKRRKTCSWLTTVQRVVVMTRRTDKAWWGIARAWNIWTQISRVKGGQRRVTQGVAWKQMGSMRSLGRCILEIYWASAHTQGRGLAIGPKRLLNIRSASERVRTRNWRRTRWCWSYLYGWWWC